MWGHRQVSSLDLSILKFMPVSDFIHRHIVFDKLKMMKSLKPELLTVLMLNLNSHLIGFCGRYWWKELLANLPLTFIKL